MGFGFRLRPSNRIGIATEVRDEEPEAAEVTPRRSRARACLFGCASGTKHDAQSIKNDDAPAEAKGSLVERIRGTFARGKESLAQTFKRFRRDRERAPSRGPASPRKAHSPSGKAGPQRCSPHSPGEAHIDPPRRRRTRPKFGQSNRPRPQAAPSPTAEREYSQIRVDDGDEDSPRVRVRRARPRFGQSKRPRPQAAPSPTAEREYSQIRVDDGDEDSPRVRRARPRFGQSKRPRPQAAPSPTAEREYREIKVDDGEEDTDGTSASLASAASSPRRSLTCSSRLSDLVQPASSESSMEVILLDDDKEDCYYGEFHRPSTRVVDALSDSEVESIDIPLGGASLHPCKADRDLVQSPKAQLIPMVESTEMMKIWDIKKPKEIGWERCAADSRSPIPTIDLAEVRSTSPPRGTIPIYLCGWLISPSPEPARYSPHEEPSTPERVTAWAPQDKTPSPRQSPKQEDKDTGYVPEMPYNPYRRIWTPLPPIPQVGRFSSNQFKKRATAMEISMDGEVSTTHVFGRKNQEEDGGEVDEDEARTKILVKEGEDDGQAAITKFLEEVQNEPKNKGHSLVEDDRWENGRMIRQRNDEARAARRAKIQAHAQEAKNRFAKMLAKRMEVTTSKTLNPSVPKWGFTQEERSTREAQVKERLAQHAAARAAARAAKRALAAANAKMQAKRMDKVDEEPNQLVATSHEPLHFIDNNGGLNTPRKPEVRPNNNLQGGRKSRSSRRPTSGRRHGRDDLLQ